MNPPRPIGCSVDSNDGNNHERWKEQVVMKKEMELFFY